MKLLAIIPARSGSKGVRDKNIRPLCGLPMISYSIRESIVSSVFKDVVVSTDSEDYAAIARDHGAWVPFLRPAQLASDSAIALDTYVHVVERLKEGHGRTYDGLFVLQPTSPLRKAQHIEEAAELLRRKDVDAVVSTTTLEHPIEWVNALPDDLCMRDFLTQSVPRINRQELDTLYRLNGAIYGSKIDPFLENEGFYGPNTYAYVMDRRYSIDIDDELDFEIAECLMNREFEE